ncbi:spondin-2-like [Rhincodon typus]|uniref:spondin-2-like n=1 Tax=Rhincodon typus TaxID=259920 RepID=UPI00202EE8CC|nr:spondin-2-like [Rhincodon typus]
MPLQDSFEHKIRNPAHRPDQAPSQGCLLAPSAQLLPAGILTPSLSCPFTALQPQPKLTGARSLCPDLTLGVDTKPGSLFIAVSSDQSTGMGVFSQSITSSVVHEFGHSISACPIGQSISRQQWLEKNTGLTSVDLTENVCDPNRSLDVQRKHVFIVPHDCFYTHFFLDAYCYKDSFGIPITAISLPFDLNPLCPSHGAASYSLTFEGKWKPSAFPKQYPMYRPPAQWSPLIAVTHNDEYHLWQLDSLARAGVQEYTEKGTHTILAQEVEETKNKMHSIAGFFKGPAIPSGIGQRLMKFTVYPTHPLLSFMVRIVPSPDWFVGGDSIILCEANHWKELVTLDLYPYDAGTDSGFTFSSPNFATVPQDKITQVISCNF